MNGRLQSWLVVGLFALALLAGAGTAAAQSGYDDYESSRWSIGLGAGLVEPDGDSEIYYMANLRWRITGRDGRGRSYSDDPNQEHYRGRPPGGEYGGGIRGYLEPEIGYWETSDRDSDYEDLMVGLNLVGVVPTRAADFFIGVGFGLHQTDGKAIIRDDSGNAVGRLDFDESRLGGNIQVGVEIKLSQSTGIFGLGRLDILEDQPNERLTKIVGGVRFHF